MTAPEGKREFRILGPFEARENGRALAIGTGKQRALLALLLLDAGDVVSTDRLIDALWGERPPASALNSVHIYVSQLRKVLGEGCLITSGHGYLLALEPEQVDLGRFERVLGEGRELLAAGEAKRASEVLREGLALWRGPPLADLASEPFAQGEIARLEELHLEALEERIEADLALGRHGRLVPELGALVRANPLRERLRAQLMLALYRSGRQAEALETYRQARTTLVEEVGLEPGRRLQELERAILSQDPTLDLPGAAAVSLRRPLRRGLLLIAIGAVLVLAAITISVVEFTAEDSRTLGSVAANSLAAIDSATNRLVADVKVGDGPTSVASGEGAVWVTDRDDNTVSRIDVRTSTVRQTVVVGSGPNAIAVGAGAIWVANALDGTVSRIDPETNKVVQTIKVGNTPNAIAFGEKAVWVANGGDRTVWKLDPASGDRLRTLPVGAAAGGIAVGEGAVWLTDPAGNALLRLDARTRTVTRVNGVGSGPTAVVFGAGAVWVANNLDGTVSRVDADRGVVTDTVPVGVAPNGIAVTRNAVWVTDEATGTLVRIDPRSRKPAARRQLGGRPEGVAVADGSLWVAVQAGGAAHRGGTLRLLLPIGTFDAPAAQSLLSVVYDGLVGFKRVGGAEGDAIVPDLATALPLPTDGGRTYTFRLRHGLRFSTGRPVKASDVRSTFERHFRAHPETPDFYEGIVGGRECKERPKRCDLSGGVVADDASRTVTFHLVAPDPEFLYKLALSLAVVVPARTAATGERPLPGTGPYRIARYQRNRSIRLVRNRRFRPWSRAAQPDGNPDVIELRFWSRDDERVTAVERGRADWTTIVPTYRLGELRTRYAAQVHITPRAETVFVELNVRRPPFNDLLARRAVNYAVDRARIVELAGGADLAAPTCQILPPNFPGYRPFCTYTADPSHGGSWSAPDLARARELVERSGTKGMAVDMIGLTGNNVYGAGTTVVADALRLLGYHVSLLRFRQADSYFDYKSDRGGRLDAAENGWIQDYPAPSTFVAALFGCNPYFCDRAFERRMQRALAVQARDQHAANELWARLERELVHRGIVVPLVNPKQIDLVSRRVGNYQRHPLLGILISQLWVR